MKKKLELKDIARYLPYIVKGYFFKNIDLVTGICVEHNIISSLNCGNVEIKNFKPILRPLSDLYCTITHNGIKIVPAIEIAKMCDNGHNHTDSKVCTYFGLIVIATIKCDDVEKISIYYNEDGISSIKMSWDNVMMATYHKIVNLLHELKIDYRGLINAGLAIDANTLGTNPYK